MSHRKTQVIFVTDGIFPHAIGGMQRHSRLLIEALAETGEVDLTVIHPHDTIVFGNTPNIEEVCIPADFNGFYLLKNYEYSKLTYKEIRKRPEAVVYAQGFSVLYGMKDIGKRVIINQHGLEPFQCLTMKEKIKTWPMRKLERFQFRHAARVISLGGRLTDILKREVHPAVGKIVTIPNAVNTPTPPIRNYEKDRLELLFVGRFAFNKGINILMETIEKLNEEGYLKRLHFNIVGKGPLYEEYTRRYNFDNVSFLGFADEEQLAALYRSNDLFVFPTRFEGMPTVVLEAMAAGMPVVVSETGATSELVDSANGFLIEKDNVRALKWAIQRFYQIGAAERLALSEASLKRVNDKYTWKKVARIHLDLFHNFKA